MSSTVLVERGKKGIWRRCARHTAVLALDFVTHGICPMGRGYKKMIGYLIPRRLNLNNGKMIGVACTRQWHKRGNGSNTGLSKDDAIITYFPGAEKKVKDDNTSQSCDVRVPPSPIWGNTLKLPNNNARYIWYSSSYDSIT